jgi:hypothetical protein
MLGRQHRRRDRGRRDKPLDSWSFHISQGQPDEIVGQAWRAQQRLHRRYRHLVGHGKRTPVAVAAIARELVGFIWAAMTRHESRRQAA